MFVLNKDRIIRRDRDRPIENRTGQFIEADLKSERLGLSSSHGLVWKEEGNVQNL